MPDTKSNSQNFISRFFNRDGKGSLSERVGNNEKKITLLKNIIQAPKVISPEFKELGKSPVSESLDSIHIALDQLLQTIRDDQQFEADKAEDARKLREQKDREDDENKLETRFEGVKKIAGKILKPFQSIWSKIWGFISTVLLGNVLLRIIKWMGDQKNQEKFKNILRFFKDWWPTMLASYLLFGTGFTKMVAGLLKVVGWGITKLVGLIPKLMAAIAKLKVGKLLKMIPGGGKLKGLTGMFQMGAGAFEGGGLVQEFANGGKVSGPGGVDKVPAKLTAGEFVMSKGAVNKWGVDTLEGMNAAGGGTNIPTIEGLPGLGGGGGGTNSLTEQAKTKTVGGALKDILFGENRMSADDKWMKMFGGGLVQHFKNGGYVSKPKEEFINRMVKEYPDVPREEIIKQVEKQQEIRRAREESDRKSGRFQAHPLLQPPSVSGENRVFPEDEESDEGVTINLQDFAKTEPVLATVSKKSLNKTSAVPIKAVPTNVKTVPGPPVKRSSVIAYKEQQQKQVPKPLTPTSGNKLPDFDPEVWISQDKIEQLGISI